MDLPARLVRKERPRRGQRHEARGAGPVAGRRRAGADRAANRRGGARPVEAGLRSEVNNFE